jgi:hypothetical protein
MQLSEQLTLTDLNDTRQGCRTVLVLRFRQRDIIPTSCLFSDWLSSSSLKMEAIFSSETSVEFHLTTRSFIPKDALRDCENLGNPATHQLIGPYTL